MVWKSPVESGEAELLSEAFAKALENPRFCIPTKAAFIPTLAYVVPLRHDEKRRLTCVSVCNRVRDEERLLFSGPP